MPRLGGWCRARGGCECMSGFVSLQAGDRPGSHNLGSGGGHCGVDFAVQHRHLVVDRAGHGFELRVRRAGRAVVVVDYDELDQAVRRQGGLRLGLQSVRARNVEDHEL